MSLEAFRASALTASVLAVALAYTDEMHPDEMHPTSAPTAVIQPAIILAAGDIAGCADQYKDEETARMLADMPGTILALGDLVYQDGTRWQFRNCYHPSWGQLLSRTRPTPGNHEYRTDEAAPYYEYFGSRAGPAGKGYYTFTLGSWRIYSLNSERLIPEQTTWLRRHLRDNPSKCVLAFWHKPLYTSGQNIPTAEVRPLFHELWTARVEVVLNAHQHNYERFRPQDADSNYQEQGVRQFVIGTGGAELTGFTSVAKNSVVRYVGDWGVLKMTLEADEYRWRFVPLLGGSPVDAGSARCVEDPRL
jgi:hypothetical protein